MTSAARSNLSAAVSASGYRSVSRPTNPSISTQYTADQLEQGGAAVSIAANVGQGLIISAPPFPTSTTNLDLDGDGVPDTLQGTGSLTSYGSPRRCRSARPAATSRSACSIRSAIR